ncbi:hypothetical protein MWU54_02275 [Marivita sp. S6314]|uniref:hypothetical protein n=1 Tax=Marivita sp. S6314 TaxID=2926406 RepID=UPI001FF1C7D5|nr:hypothetical protein [Marivita sp. S6314]MCK0148836.1 hypothetical protein [Marivita sp. S6314]
MSLVASPSWAEEGTSLMEEGAKLFFRGLMEEMEPALKELEGLAEEIEPTLQEFVDGIGPTLKALLDEVEDWSAYEPPVVLPNGDILLKRKPDMPSPDALPAPGDGEIDI